MASKHLQYPRFQSVAVSNSLLGLCFKARTSEDDKITFDLSRTESITPFGIVLLAGTILECLNQGKKATYIGPKKTRVRTFLSGIGFNKFFELSDEQHRIESPNVQLRRLDRIDPLLTDQILEVFGESIHMSEGVKCSLKMSLNELMTNVFDHSESKRGCYVCAQFYKKEKKIRLCIADFGIGIMKSLRKAPQYAQLSSHYESIVLAVREGVTSREIRAGFGLNLINRFVESNEGKMYILSGNGKALWNFTGLKKRRKERQTMRVFFDGTIIDLHINADKEGYYYLESMDGDIF